jgi:hypothetical protein
MIKFKDWECDVEFSKYRNGRTAILLVDRVDGSPIATATANLPLEILADNEVFIKDWMENEGILSALINAGIIEDTGRTVRNGFVFANVARILVKPDEN